jgi:hypothetical protein
MGGGGVGLGFSHAVEIFTQHVNYGGGGLELSFYYGSRLLLIYWTNSNSYRINS